MTMTMVIVVMVFLPYAPIFGNHCGSDFSSHLVPFLPFPPLNPARVPLSSTAGPGGRRPPNGIWYISTLKLCTCVTGILRFILGYRLRIWNTANFLMVKNLWGRHSASPQQFFGCGVIAPIVGAYGSSCTVHAYVISSLILIVWTYRRVVSMLARRSTKKAEDPCIEHIVALAIHWISNLTRSILVLDARVRRWTNKDDA